MMAAAARALVALAVYCLGERRRQWARAMEAEFEEASEDGRALAFAAGCLVAAWRELGAHEEGRLAIASHAFAFALLIPASAFLLSIVLTGFPYSFLGQAGIHGSPVVSDGNQFALPALALLVVLSIAAHLRLAWLALERDWSGAAAMGMLIASLTASLFLLTAVGFAHHVSALVQAAVVAVEFACIAALSHWQAQLAHAES